MVRLAWLGLVGVALLGACGKSQSGSEPVTLEQLPGSIASVACESLARCCSSSGHAFDIVTCKRTLSADFEQELTRESSARVRYDADAAGACLDAITANTHCGDIETGNSSACERIFNGTLPLGAECEGDDECREDPGQDVSCYSEFELGPRVCTLEQTTTITPVRHGKQGESCVGTCAEGDCDGSIPVPAVNSGGSASMSGEVVLCHRREGLWCSGGTCQRLAEVGSRCDSFDSCVGDAFCAFDSGRCTARRANGQPCNSENECQSGNCAGPDAPSNLNPGGTAPTRCAPANQVGAAQCEVESDDDVVPEDSN